jgi:hypothetical protein
MPEGIDRSAQMLHDKIAKLAEKEIPKLYNAHDAFKAHTWQALVEGVGKQKTGWDDPTAKSDDKIVEMIDSAIEREDWVSVSNYAMFMFWRENERKS